MGFRKCAFHKPEWDSKARKETMVVDDYVVDTKWNRTTRTWDKTLKKKEHPKWDSFYKLDFTKELKLWLYLENNSVIKYIWIEGERVHGVKQIYDWSKPPCAINSKIDIIRLFPKDIQRDFVLNSIFG